MVKPTSDATCEVVMHTVRNSLGEVISELALSVQERRMCKMEILLSPAIMAFCQPLSRMG